MADSDLAVAIGLSSTVSVLLGNGAGELGRVRQVKMILSKQILVWRRRAATRHPPPSRHGRR